MRRVPEPMALELASARSLSVPSGTVHIVIIISEGSSGFAPGECVHARALGREPETAVTVQLGIVVTGSSAQCHLPIGHQPQELC